ncbi:peptidase M23 [Paramagnetospirillum kuznetsovii]|uniref:Peptidase M23 n=1 Tax=Paramagnetospirillum kuznetsovii TaxID=2053833 RepID=A0A364NU33_9PROT|nr:peptidoglycan DD-metalloendopeptidase family protein [Paramagnetospirillum kuznetsovii]RAU20598.1 peptidase M23 [Paramagnetospirillum kuznetsovii]
MAGHVTAKLKRSLKALALVILVGAAGLFAARPFVPSFSPFGDEEPLHAPSSLYMDLDNEGKIHATAELSDSEIEDRARRPVDYLVRVGSGDKLSDLLGRAGVVGPDAVQAIDALISIFDPRNLKAGQKVTVTFAPAPHGFGEGEFQQISLAADPVRDVFARRDEASGRFKPHQDVRPVTKQVAHYSGSIKSSLYESASSAGVPAQVIINMIKALSYDVDFQRDIQSGDTFEVMFEGWYDTKGKLVRNGELLYAGLDLSGAEIQLYRYDDGHGNNDFFNAKGESAKKALLKTPVDGAKITSGFGMRNHPILGYSKMHKGIDFGVPPGTPIQAAGDGSVEMAGPNGAYGNYVRIRHGSGFATAYAHMSRVAPGVHTGRRVMQGQIIGFVGSTGRSTGPHLHYEVLQGNTQVNPMSIKVPTGVKLAGKDLERFQAHKRQSDLIMAQIPSATHVASNAVGKLGGRN